MRSFINNGSFTVQGLTQVFYDVKDIQIGSPPHGTWLVYRHAAYMTMSQFRSRGSVSRCDMKMFETSKFGISLLLLNLELLFFDVISFIFGIQTIFFSVKIFIFLSFNFFKLIKTLIVSFNTPVVV